MSDDAIVNCMILPSLIFLSLAVLLFISSALEEMMLLCERTKCGPLPRVLILGLHFFLQLIAFPLSVLMVILSVLLLSILAVIQAFIWALFLMVTHPAGIIMVLVMLLVIVY